MYYDGAIVVCMSLDCAMQPCNLVTILRFLKIRWPPCAISRLVCKLGIPRLCIQDYLRQISDHISPINVVGAIGVIVLCNLKIA